MINKRKLYTILACAFLGIAIVCGVIIIKISLNPADNSELEASSAPILEILTESSNEETSSITTIASSETVSKNETSSNTTSSEDKVPNQGNTSSSKPTTQTPSQNTTTKPSSQTVVPTPPKHEPTDIEQEVLDIMNRYRAEEGLAPLEFNYKLYECAKIRTEETMVQWSHTRPDGRRYITVLTDNGFKDTGWHGENAAKNFKDAESMVKALMESEGHRKNIMFPDYTSVALCVLENEHGLYQMVQIFEG